MAVTAEHTGLIPEESFPVDLPVQITVKETGHSVLSRLNEMGKASHLQGQPDLSCSHAPLVPQEQGKGGVKKDGLNAAALPQPRGLVKTQKNTDFLL